MSRGAPRSWTIEVAPIAIGSQTKRLPPSLNARMHWAVRKRWAGAFREAVAWHAKLRRIPALKKARVEVINRTCHPMDRDNLYSAAKPLIDGLVTAGVLPDDSEEYLDEICRHERVNKFSEEDVVIVITELPYGPTS